MSNNKEIQVLSFLLEKYSGKKVQLINKEKIEEVKRTKMTQPFQVRNYVAELLRKYKLKNSSRIVLKGNIILVETESPEIDTWGYKNVSFELMENGFTTARPKKINDKSFTQMIDKTTRIIVLLPSLT